MGVLDRQVALITGGASGIGLEIAKAYLAAGAKGVTLLDVNESALAAARTSLGGGDKLHTIAGSSSDEATNERAVAETIDKFGGIDTAVLAAGVGGQPARLHETTLEDYNRVMNVNLTGVFLGLKHVVAGILKQGNPNGGSVVLISSVCGLDGLPSQTAYSASKFGIRGLVAVASREYGPDKIRVNAICPGWIETNMTRSPTLPPTLLEQMGAASSLGRYGNPSEIAFASLFLSDPKNTYTTGTTLKVDGGWSRWV